MTIIRYYHYLCLTCEFESYCSTAAYEIYSNLGTRCRYCRTWNDLVFYPMEKPVFPYSRP